MSLRDRRYLPVEAIFSKFEDPRDHICTMDSKNDPLSYRFQLADMIIPAQLNKTQIQNVNQISKNAYQAINCRDYAKMDIRLCDNNFYVIDVNANPFIGLECGLVRSAELEGYSYREFTSQIINSLAIECDLNKLLTTSEISMDFFNK